MAYSIGTPILGSREEVVQSLFLDCSAISTAAGFTQAVKVIIRQFQGFPEMDSPGIIIDTGSDSTPEWFLQDLAKRTVTTTIIGFVYDDTSTLATKLETWMADVQRAIVLNPYRTISGTPKAWTSQVKGEGTMYSGTLGRFAMVIETQIFGTR